MPETGYGSEEFLRACRLAAACREIEGSGLRAAWARLRAGSATLARYQRRLPLTELRLTASPAGRMIAQHFAILDRGRPRFRTAQGVLALPDDFATYLRGRHRQALRTNIKHARRQGYTVHSYAVDNWVPGVGDSRRAAIAPGPIERWLLMGPDGNCAADSILSVDSEVALLHGLVSFGPYARWLLHAEIIERLCGDCRLLVANTDDAYFLAPGTQHFQRLLGFQITRLRITGSTARPDSPRPQPSGLCWGSPALSCGIVPSPAPEPRTPSLLAAA
jgi:hypothetical protein